MSGAWDTLARLCLEDGRRWGDTAEAFQLADARAVLDPEGAPYHFLTRARGASKTSDLAGIALAMLLDADGPQRFYWLAADEGQGKLAIDAVAGFVGRSRTLGDRVDVQSRQVVVPATGARLEVLPADAPGAWGLLPDAVFVDDLAGWADTTAPRRLWEAVSTAVAKRPGCRLVVLTMAGDPAHFSRAVLDHALTSPLWRVHEVPGPPPWADPERLAEQRARLTESAYRRLFENVWTEGEDRLTSVEAVRECATLDGPLDYEPECEPYVIGLDLGLKRDRTVAAVCHREGARVVLDRMATWQGTRLRPVRIESVEEWLQQAASSYSARIVLDPWQAVGLLQRLRERRLKVEEFAFTAQSVGRLAGTLYGLLRDRNLALPDDPELLDELGHVQLRETSSGVFKMEKPGAGRSDDRATALALAAVDLLREPERPAPPAMVPCPWDGPAGPQIPPHGAEGHYAAVREELAFCEDCLNEQRARAARRAAAESEPERAGRLLIRRKRER